MHYTLHSTDTFNRWLAGVTGTPRNQLLSRLARVETGNFGDYKALGDNLFELRCFFGGGLRIYYSIRHQQVVLLLAGGDKTSQRRDIAKAAALLAELED